MFIHYNMKYPWMCPTAEEIAEAYKKAYGKDPRESDVESSSSDEDDSDEDELEQEPEEGDEQAAPAPAPA